MAIKLNRVNALLFTIRNYVNKRILRTIDFAMFDSPINYANLTWGQNLNAMSRIVILQKKVLMRIMNFQSRDSHSSALFKSNHILKLEDKILIANILFVNNSFNNLLHPIFKSWFIFCSDVIKQSHLRLTRYLNHLTELILMKKIESLQEPLIVGIKLNISSSLKTYSPSLVSKKCVKNC